MADALDLAALAESLGDYMRKNTDRLLAEFYMEMKSISIFEVLPNIKDEFPLVPMSVGEIVQPNKLDGSWNPTNSAIGFAPRILKVRDCKVDLEIIPQRLHKSWLGHMAKAGAADNTEAAIPFEAFIMQSIIKAAARDIEKKAIWRGVYDINGGNAQSTMDGYLTIVTNDISDGTIPDAQVAPTGNTTNSNAVDNFEAVYDLVPDELKDDDLICLSSPTLKRFYEQDYRTTFGALPYNQQFKKTLLDGTNTELVSVPGFGISERIIIQTRKDQGVIGVDSLGDMDILDVEKAKRVLNIMMSFRLGINYSKTTEIFCNDEEVES